MQKPEGYSEDERPKPENAADESNRPQYGEYDHTEASELYSDVNPIEPAQTHPDVKS